MTETGVIHGRFQVLHNDHLTYILAGKDRCRHLVVGITNPDPTLTTDDPAGMGRGRSAANPLTYFERYTMLRAALLEYGLDHGEFSLVPLPINRPELFKYYVPMDAVFYLTIYDVWGRRKLDIMKSLGLRTEVMWERPAEEKGLTASEVRARMADDESWEALVPPSVARLMSQWGIPDRIRRLRDEQRAGKP